MALGGRIGRCHFWEAEQKILGGSLAQIVYQSELQPWPFAAELCRVLVWLYLMPSVSWRRYCFNSQQPATLSNLLSACWCINAERP